MSPKDYIDKKHESTPHAKEVGKDFSKEVTDKKDESLKKRAQLKKAVEKDVPADRTKLNMNSYTVELKDYKGKGYTHVLKDKLAGVGYEKVKNLKVSYAHMMAREPVKLNDMREGDVITVDQGKLYVKRDGKLFIGGIDIYPWPEEEEKKEAKKEVTKREKPAEKESEEKFVLVESVQEYAKEKLGPYMEKAFVKIDVKGKTDESVKKLVDRLQKIEEVIGEKEAGSDKPFEADGGRIDFDLNWDLRDIVVFQENEFEEFERKDLENALNEWWVDSRPKEEAAEREPYVGTNVVRTKDDYRKKEVVKKEPTPEAKEKSVEKPVAEEKVDASDVDKVGSEEFFKKYGIEGEEQAEFKTIISNIDSFLEKDSSFLADDFWDEDPLSKFDLFKEKTGVLSKLYGELSAMKLLFSSFYNDLSNPAAVKYQELFFKLSLRHIEYEEKTNPEPTVALLEYHDGLLAGTESLWKVPGKQALIVEQHMKSIDYLLSNDTVLSAEDRKKLEERKSMYEKL